MRTRNADGSFVKEDENERFFRRVTKTGNCWLWTGTKNRKGYGLFHLGRSAISAHRYLVRHEIPDRLLALHTCDNPACVNPQHIFFGTNQDNMDDMKRKGRSQRLAGERNNSATLNESQVLEIIKIPRAVENNSQIAHRFGVTPSTIFKIRHNETWTHLPRN